MARVSHRRLVTDADAETMQIPAGFEEAYEVAVEYTDRLLATRAALMGALETVLGLGDYATAEYAAGIRESARALLAELHGEKP